MDPPCNRMPFPRTKLSVPIERNLNTDCLAWPQPGEAMDDSALGGNRCYMDLRRLPWCHARTAYALESQYISRILSSADPERDCETVEGEADDDPALFGLDLGVASTVLALSSAGCVPFSSCNGAVFGGHHNEQYPLVAFFGRAKMTSLLVECAESAEVGLRNAADGAIVVYADDVRRMLRFAAALIERRAAFRLLPPEERTRVPKRYHGDQQELQMDLWPIQ